MYSTLYRTLLAAALITSASLPLQAASRNWSYTYNSLGLLETADGPRTDVADITRYTYDSQGNLTQVTNALGQVTRLTDFDAQGRPKSITDPNGVVTVLTYNGQGWLTAVTTAGSTTRFEHDVIGQITRLIRADGSSLTYSYDGARRLSKITNALGESIEYDYDAMGNRTEQRLKDASNRLTQQQTWVYDELGRLLRSVGAAGQTNRYQYDLNDNRTGQTNPRNFSHSNSFDALDRLVSSTDPLDGSTRRAYDAQDNLTEIKDPRGVTTRYVYDGLGNLTQQISPDSGTTTYAYDAAGNKIRRTDARGLVTTYRYDALNRPTDRQYPAKPALNVKYHYDMTANGNFGIGRLTAIQDASGMLGYRYDAQGNLTEQVRSVAVNGKDQYDSLRLAYDGANQLTRIDYPVGFSVLYQRNAVGQVTDIQIVAGNKPAATFASQLSYQPFGPLSALTWANGVSLTRSYDQDYRLTQQTVAGWESQYSYDANGNITQLNSNLLGALDYRYDALDRLTEEKQTSRQQTYSYDAVGNRTRKTTTAIVNGIPKSTSTLDYQYTPTSNRLTRTGNTPVLSDATGNLTQDRADRTLTYDEQNRLATVKVGKGIAVQYRYNVSAP